MSKFMTLEGKIYNTNNDFFWELNNLEFYVVKSTDTKIVAEHSTTRAILEIYVENGAIVCNIKNALGKKYFFNKLYLGFFNDDVIKDLDVLIKCLKEKSLIDFINVNCNINVNSNTELCTDTQREIKTICNSISDLLVYKNKKYGNSAIEPINVFYKQDNKNSILIRLDDKLSRIKNSDKLRVNDIVDIIGYLVLLLIYLNIDIKDIEKLKD